MMKAAIIHAPGTAPRYEDCTEPVAGAGQEVFQVLAASIKNIDRMLANGTHYHKGGEVLPRGVGIDGVGTLSNGTRVYSGGNPGFIAERTVVPQGMSVPVPDGLDSAVAAALPNPALSAWFALNGKAAFKEGETVVVLGATGVTGKLAVAFAKEMGAGRIVAAGRNPTQCAKLPGLGADEVVDLSADDETVRASFLAALTGKPADLVLDYVWGHPAEILLEALSGHDLGAESHRTRYVQIGEMAGPTISLKAGTLRGSAIEMFGQGGGSISKEMLGQAPAILTRIFDLALKGKLTIEIEKVPLKDIESAWTRSDAGGKRLVVVP